MINGQLQMFNKACNTRQLGKQFAWKTQDRASKNKTRNYFNSKAPYFGFFLLKNFWRAISPCLFLRSPGVGKDGTNVDHGTEIGLNCTL